jgi:hypothetical protein
MGEGSMEEIIVFSEVMMVEKIRSIIEIEYETRYLLRVRSASRAIEGRRRPEREVILLLRCIRYARHKETSPKVSTRYLMRYRDTRVSIRE